MTACTGFKVGRVPVRYLSVLLVSRKVLKKVYQYCLSFFWKWKVGSGQGACICRKEICLPKSEWGLGLKNVVEWNQAFILQFIRALLAEEGFL
ncbi:hypothetical protein V6Z11_A03G097400 [Gossypium hirsutum]